jgi:hypothetical protein
VIAIIRFASGIVLITPKGRLCVCLCVCVCVCVCTPTQELVFQERGFKCVRKEQIVPLETGISWENFYKLLKSSSHCQKIPRNRRKVSQWPSCGLYWAMGPYVWLGLSFWHPSLPGQGGGGGGSRHLPRNGCPGCLPDSCFVVKEQTMGEA